MNSDYTTLNKIPYRQLSKLTDLVSLDRDILSLFINHKNEYFLLYLFESLVEYDQYIFWKTQLSDLYAFFNKEIGLKDLIIKDNKDFFYVIQSDYENLENFEDPEIYKFIYQIPIEDVDSTWLPKNNPLWNFSIPEVLTPAIARISVGDYVEILRDQALYFKLTPKNLQYKSTISTYDAAGFLRLITSSFLQFIVFDFQQNFQDLFSQDVGFINTMNHLQSILTPRISDVKYGSFEVALSVDDFNPLPQGDARFFDWQRNAIDEYKKEVIDFDFDSVVAIERIVKKYPKAIRRRIFNPFFSIAANPNYTVEVSDRQNTYTESINSVRRETRRVISQQSEEEQLREEINNLELVTFVVAVPEGTKLNDIDKRRLRSGTLSFKKSDSQPITFEEEFIEGGRDFTPIEPLPIQIRTQGNYLILTCDVFQIDVSGSSQEELYYNFKNEINKYYITTVMNNPRLKSAQTFNEYYKVS